MEKIINSFSNRDIAFLLLTLLIVIILPINKDLRKVLINSLKYLGSQVNGYIFYCFISLSIYVTLIVFILYKLNFWNLGLLKDTLFWIIPALIFIYKTKDILDIKEYIPILKDIFAISLILEYIINTYTFSLITESIISLIVGILVFIITLLKAVKKNESSIRVMSFILALFGFYFFGAILYIFLNDFSEVYKIDNLKTFLLPVILTLLLVPFTYLILIYDEYENLFRKFNNHILNKSIRRRTKIYTIKICGISFRKLKNINMYLWQFDYEGLESDLLEVSNNGQAGFLKIIQNH